MISKRLEAIAALVEKSAAGQKIRVADIGCDHGYLDIELVNRGVALSCIASDINRGPLNKAQENIALFKLSNVIETRLSNGLHNFESGEADAIIIAGMGGLLMKQIIEEGTDICRSAKELILQPQSDIEAFRRFIFEFGLHIVDEDFIIEGGKYYPILRTAWNCETKCHDAENDIQFRYGRVLFERKCEALYQFLKAEREVLNSLMNELKDKELTDKIAGRIESLGADILLNRLALEKFEN